MESQRAPASAPFFDPYEGDFERSEGSSPESVFFTPNPLIKRTSQLSTSADKAQSHDSSLTLSRSNSTKAFSPGAHRRSHPSLQHLSLAPLTPKYPINPSDYEAYFNPDTSQLHTSASLSHIASLPNPGGILTNSPATSRANSRTRGLKRKAKSTVAFKAQGDNVVPTKEGAAAHGAATSEGYRGHITPDTLNPSSKSRSIVSGKRADQSWLVQTGLALTEGSRESKGQSWLVKRASSTSLQTPILGEVRNKATVDDRPVRSPYASGRNTPNRSRRNSRDRRRSRRDLTMTPAAMNKSSTQLSQTAKATDDPGMSRLITTSSHAQGYSGADWVDSQTHAEIAADLEKDRANELEAAQFSSHDEYDREWWREDRYGAVDFEGQWDSDDANETADEAEVRKALKARRFGLGNWIDGVVDVFLQLDEDDDDEDLELVKPVSEPAEMSNRKTMRQTELSTVKLGNSPGKSNGDDSDEIMEAAPSNPKSVWEDVAWFGRLALRTARS